VPWSIRRANVATCLRWPTAGPDRVETVETDDHELLRVGPLAARSRDRTGCCPHGHETKKKKRSVRGDTGSPASIAVPGVWKQGESITRGGCPTGAALLRCGDAGDRVRRRRADGRGAELMPRARWRARSRAWMRRCASSSGGARHAVRGRRGRPRCRRLASHGGLDGRPTDVTARASAFAAALRQARLAWTSSSRTSLSHEHRPSPDSRAWRRTGGRRARGGSTLGWPPRWILQEFLDQRADERAATAARDRPKTNA